MNAEKEPVSEIDLLTKQGVSKFNDENYTEAIDLFNRAIDINPEDGNLFNLRAHAKYSLGDLKGAKSDFMRSKRLKSKSKKTKVKKKQTARK